MRYSLHNEHGHRIGESETAQGIGNIARSGKWSYDTCRENKFPCVVYSDDIMGMVGAAFEHRFEAMAACGAVVAKGVRP